MANYFIITAMSYQGIGKNIHFTNAFTDLLASMYGGNRGQAQETFARLSTTTPYLNFINAIEQIYATRLPPSQNSGLLSGVPAIGSSKASSGNRSITAKQLWIQENPSLGESGWAEWRKANKDLQTFKDLEARVKSLKGASSSSSSSSSGESAPRTSSMNFAAWIRVLLKFYTEKPRAQKLFDRNGQAWAVAKSAYPCMIHEAIFQTYQQNRNNSALDTNARLVVAQAGEYLDNGFTNKDRKAEGDLVKPINQLNALHYVQPVFKSQPIGQFIERCVAELGRADDEPAFGLLRQAFNITDKTNGVLDTQFANAEFATYLNKLDAEWIKSNGGSMVGKFVKPPPSTINECDASQLKALAKARGVTPTGKTKAELLTSLGAAGITNSDVYEYFRASGASVAAVAEDDGIDTSGLPPTGLSLAHSTGVTSSSIGGVFSASGAGSVVGLPFTQGGSAPAPVAAAPSFLTPTAPAAPTPFSSSTAAPALFTTPNFGATSAVPNFMSH